MTTVIGTCTIGMADLTQVAEALVERDRSLRGPGVEIAPDPLAKGMDGLFHVVLETAGVVS